MYQTKWLEAALLLIAFAAALPGAQTREDDATAASDPTAYRIGPGDVLQIRVWKEPDASADAATVQPDGRLSLALIGELRAAGLTPPELEALLAKRFGELIRGARVTVTLRELNSHRVYVIGEVRREGPIRLTAPMTVLQALAEAGGVTDYAKRRNIYILRLVNGHQARLPFDYDAVVRGQRVEQNAVLLSGDTIVVPR